jgi:hypothetical protein
MHQVERFRAEQAAQFEKRRDCAGQQPNVLRGLGEETTTVTIGQRRAAGFAIPLVDPCDMLISQRRRDFVEAAQNAENAAKIRWVTQKMQELHGRRRIGAAE